MTTYYGVWSGNEWYHIGDKFFYTAVLGIAKAQAMTANHIWGELREGYWKAHVIGQDGLPESEPANQPTFEIKREFLQCKMARCAMCGEPAKEWVEVRIKGWMCEQHSHVSVGCLSEKEEG